MASGDGLLRNKYRLIMRRRACRIVNPINAFSFPLNVNPLQSVTSVALHSSVFFLDKNLNIFSETKCHFHINPSTIADWSIWSKPGLIHCRYLCKGPRPSCWQFDKDWIESDIGATVQCSLPEADSSQVRPSQARTKLETASKQTLSLGSGSILSKWPTSPSPHSLCPAATHSLGTLYTTLTLGRSHTFCTSDIL